MTCGHNPWLAACLASNIVLFEADDEIPLLEWTHPHRLVQDKRTLQMRKKFLDQDLRPQCTFRCDWRAGRNACEPIWCRLPRRSDRLTTAIGAVRLHELGSENWPLLLRGFHA